MRRIRLPILGFLTVAALTAGRAQAAMIQPDTAVASSEFFSPAFDGLAIHTIDGSGLPAGFTPASSHADYASGNHWTTDGTAPTDEFIDWGFAAAQTLDRMYVWNHQSTFPPAANPGYDVVSFDLTLFDAANTVLLFLDNVALAPDTATAQSILFGGALSGITRVRFDIEGTQSSGTFTGLGEVAFETATSSAVPVPEPATMTLFGVGAAVAAAGRRRRT